MRKFLLNIILFISIGLHANQADFIYNMLITPKYKFGVIIDSNDVKLNNLNNEDLAKILTRAKYLGEYPSAVKIQWKITQRHLNSNQQDESKILQDYIELVNLELKLGNYILADKIVSKGLHLIEKDPKKFAYFLVEFTQLKALLYFESELMTESENQFELAQAYISKYNLSYSLADAHKLINQSKTFSSHGRYSTSEILLLRAKRILTKFPEEKLTLIACNFHLLDNFINLNNKESFSVLRDENLSLMQGNVDSLHPYFDVLRAKDLFLNSTEKYTEETFEKSLQNLQYSYKNNTKETSTLYFANNHRLTLSGKLMAAKKLLLEFSQLSENQYPTLKINLAKIEFELAKNEYYQGSNKESIQRLKKIKDVEVEFLTNLDPLYLETIKLLALNYWALDNQSKAYHYFKLSLFETYRDYNRNFTFLSEKEKESYYETIRGFYNQFCLFAIQNKHRNKFLKDELYNIAVKSKGLLFQNTIDLKEKILKSDSSLIKEYSNWIEVKEKIAIAEKFSPITLKKFNVNIDSLKDVSEEFEKDLSLKIELLTANHENSNLYLNWKDIKSNLGKSDAAIESIRIKYYNPKSPLTHSDSSIYAFVIINGKIQTHPDLVVLPNGKELETMYYYNYIFTTKLFTEDKYSYKAYWKNIDDILEAKNINRIYLSADGVFHELNISSIYNAKKESFLLQLLDVRYLNNTAELLDKRKHIEIQDRNIILIGYPTYDLKSTDATLKSKKVSRSVDRSSDVFTREFDQSRGFTGSIPPLPGTKLEVLHIDSLYRKNGFKVNTYIEKEASELLVKSIQSPEILHIATHGYFRNSTSSSNSLLQTGLVFSGADHAYEEETLKNEIKSIHSGNRVEDGLLSSFEAQNINLQNTKLVILSACETGRGVLRDGEGVYGLKRSFQVAGSKNIIISLWKVDDEATTFFMNTFHDEFIEHGDLHLAYNKAQEKTKVKFILPYYWGAFIFIGL